MEGLPSRKEQDRLIKAYFDHVHNDFPIIFKANFTSAYQARGPQTALRPTESSVPGFLLFAMFALSARYMDSDEPFVSRHHWPAGDNFYALARAILMQGRFIFRLLCNLWLKLN